MTKTKPMTTASGLPPTDGKWVEDRDREGVLHGWIEMFGDDTGRGYTIPGASRSVSISAVYL